MSRADEIADVDTFWDSFSKKVTRNFRGGGEQNLSAQVVPLGFTVRSTQSGNCKYERSRQVYQKTHLEPFSAETDKSNVNLKKKTQLSF